MSPVASALVMFSILFPAKGWVAPNQPLNINVQSSSPITLVLTDFTGKPMDAKGEANLQSSQTVDLKHIFDEVSTPGTFVLFALPKTADSATEKDITKFVGTPLVIDVREDLRREAPPGPMITRIVPMQYAVIATDKGEMTCSFYYDVAPETVGNFISLAADGFYDGLNFFRVVPGMLIQTGDPRGDGTGGPGYRIEQEFNDRQHTEGVLSMARQTDPIEKQGAMPRAEAANSAGSQFLICLDYNNTKQLDRRYTAFGRVVTGLDVLHAIGASPVGGPTGDVPQTSQVIQKIQILPVLPGKNPYGETLSFAKPVVMPSAPPTTLPAR